MNTVILFALLITNSPRPATWTAEFSSVEACQAAGQEMAATMAPEGRMVFVCVKK